MTGIDRHCQTLTQTLTMVGVAQQVELRIVDPAVVGSSPIVHPMS